jgi:predicted NUDIX family NTP pyrophosphohydrolase
MSIKSKKSAGLLLFRKGAAGVEVMLVHPGGPFWAKKDEGSWSIPKGEFSEGEDPLEAAKREFEEEFGSPVTSSEFEPLEPVKQPSGKLVFAWTVSCDCDPSGLKSNMFSMEWPPKSGRQQEFPEVDQAAWFGIGAARLKILKGQAPFLDQLLKKLQITEDAVNPSTASNTSGASDQTSPKQQSFVW